jgi:hypothetical protein
MKLKTSIVPAAALCTTLLLIHYGAAQTPSQNAEEPDSRSTKLGSITGRVLADGQPVINASIVVARLNSTNQTRAVPVNDNGDFEVKGLEAGVYRISVAAPAYVILPAESDQETFYRVGDSVTLRMIRGGVITGKVLSADETPVVAVRVRALMIRDGNGKPANTTMGRALDQTTDDRGLYRIFGLPPGTYVVSAGGRGSSGYGVNAFDNDAPTYAPSSTRDTAAEISIGSSEERTLNIRYRGEIGHVVSGNATATGSPNTPWININLTRLVEATPDVRMSTSQNTGARGFEFGGVADGDYLVWASYASSSGDATMSEAKRLTVKGADVTGIELAVKPLATVAGELVLQPSTLETCKEKRRPLFDETLITLERSEKVTQRELPQVPLYRTAQGAPDKNGGFLLRNLGTGQYRFEVRFFARYWYLRSINRRVATGSSKDTVATQSNDVAQNGLALKLGDRVTGVKVTLAEGAASLAGQVETAKDEKLPAQLFVYLVPAEKESSSDVLRLFAVPVEADGSFMVDHVPPGHYWSLAKVAAESELASQRKLRLPDAADARMKLRQEAEASRFEIDLKPCQNMSSYRVAFK